MHPLKKFPTLDIGDVEHSVGTIEIRPSEDDPYRLFVHGEAYLSDGNVDQLIAYLLMWKQARGVVSKHDQNAVQELERLHMFGPEPKPEDIEK